VSGKEVWADVIRNIFAAFSICANDAAHETNKSRRNVILIFRLLQLQVTKDVEFYKVANLQIKVFKFNELGKGGNRCRIISA
jgi:hypothetical protein